MTPVPSDNAPAGEQLLRDALATPSTPTGANQPAGQGDTLATPSLSPTLSGPVALAAQQAAQLWANAQRARKQPCTMSPMDENIYGDNPVASQVTLQANVQQQILGANPQRIGIIFSIPANAGTPVFLMPGRAMKTSLLEGIGIINASLPFIVLQKDMLNLPALNWYAQSNAGPVTVYMVEILLRQWPQGG